MPRQHFAGERPVQRGEADDLVALRAPAAEQRLEQARELTALELGVRGEDMCRPGRRGGKQARDRISLAADQLESVGSVVGICTQPTASPFHSGTKGEKPRVSEA